MKKILILSVPFITLFFLSCSPTQESTGVWVNKEKIQGKSFGNFFILVMTADIEARVTLEDDLAAIATARGFKAVKSLELLPFNLSDPKIPAKEDVVKKIKASGCDAVFIASVINKNDTVRYEPGTTAYTVMPNYTFTGNYYGYYSNWYPTVSTSDYYAREKTYFLQSNLYDVASEEIMWSVQSKIFNPSSIKSFSRSYTSSLFTQLKKAKLLKK